MQIVVGSNRHTTRRGLRQQQSTSDKLRALHVFALYNYTLTLTALLLLLLLLQWTRVIKLNVCIIDFSSQHSCCVAIVPLLYSLWNALRRGVYFFTSLDLELYRTLDLHWQYFSVDKFHQGHWKRFHAVESQPNRKIERQNRKWKGAISYYCLYRWT